MACSGCDARKEWAKRKARLLAQRIASFVKAKPPAPKEEKARDELARREDYR